MDTGPRWHALDALRTTFADLKAYPGTTLGCGAVLSIPVALLSLYEALRPNLRSFLLQATVSFLIGIWLSFAIITVTKQYAAGSDPGVGGLLRTSLSGRLVSFAGTQLLLILVETLALVVAMLPLGAAFARLSFRGSLSLEQLSAANAALLFGAFMLSFGLAITLLLIIYLRYGLAPVASALEGRSPIQSFTRSRQVTEGKRLDFFVLLVIAFAVGVAVALVVNGPGMVVSLGAAEPTPSQNPRSLTDLLAMFSRHEPLAPAAAVILAISNYLAYAVGTCISAALVANFYLGISGDEAALVRRRQVMQPDEGSKTTSTGPLN
jgi:hypothetical protein